MGWRPGIRASHPLQLPPWTVQECRGRGLPTWWWSKLARNIQQGQIIVKTCPKPRQSRLYFKEPIGDLNKFRTNLPGALHKNHGNKVRNWGKFVTLSLSSMVMALSTFYRWMLSSLMDLSPPWTRWGASINQETVLLSFCHCQDKTVIFYPSARVITHTPTNNLFLALRLLWAWGFLFKSSKIAVRGSGSSFGIVTEFLYMINETWGSI